MCPGGGIGRRTSFRCWRSQGRGGSSPLLGTIADQRRALASWPLHRLAQAMKRACNAHDIVDQLAAIYDESVANLRQALGRYVEDGTPPDPRTRKKGAFAYP